MIFAAEQLPASVIFVVRDVKHWLSFEDVPTADRGDVLWVRECPLGR